MNTMCWIVNTKDIFVLSENMYRGKEGKMKEDFEDTILISSNAHTPVQERGGARGDKWLHDTFIR